MAGREPLAAVEPCDAGLRVRVKVVPGASRSRLAGVLGDRLKVQVAAPAEAGRANRALCELLAYVFRLPKRDVRVVTGQTQPMKTVELVGLTPDVARQRLADALR